MAKPSKKPDVKVDSKGMIKNPGGRPTKNRGTSDGYLAN